MADSCALFPLLNFNFNPFVSRYFGLPGIYPDLQSSRVAAESRVKSSGAPAGMPRRQLPGFSCFPREIPRKDFPRECRGKQHECCKAPGVSCFSAASGFSFCYCLAAGCPAGRGGRLGSAFAARHPKGISPSEYSGIRVIAVGLYALRNARESLSVAVDII
jgi:hypothetical protein